LLRIVFYVIIRRKRRSNLLVEKQIALLRSQRRFEESHLT
jgi:hypothetical protein